MVKYDTERKANLKKGSGKEKQDVGLPIPAIDLAATGRNITRLRENAGLTIRELRDIFGFATPHAIYKWQHGRAIPTIDNPQ